jgi:hypothetical protein
METNIPQAPNPLQVKKKDAEPLFLRDKKGRPLLNRKMLAQYTSGHREMRQMKDADFVDYAAWLLRQQDVLISEGVRDAVETTKNARKNVKTYTDFVKVSKTVGVFLLYGAVVFLGLLVPLYAAIYKKDTVKKAINYNLFPLVFYLMVLFLFYVFLYHNMNALVKKIMTLL